MKLAKKRDRILSFAIDIMIYFIIFMIFGFFFGQVNDQENGFVINGFPAFILFLIGIGLWPINEAFTSQTFGKKIVGLKLINKNNKDISGTQAFLRFGFGFFDCFFLVGFLVSLLNKNNQRIGDLIAETFVIEMNK
ncbi:RDD family protein [Flavobacterium sp.]|uniref:RDD family protein n=1 Tax=Flavobacterium sp. TaxID=239 RepID=UPI003751A731